MAERFRNFHDPLATSTLPEPDGSIHGGRVRISQGVIKSMRTLTHDTYELVVKCDDDCEAIGGVAGQFATIRHADLRQPRAYSFARDPEQEDSGEFRIYVRLVPKGQFSGWIAEKDRTGERVTVSGPLGGFLLDASDDTIVCIAGGSGMSAIKALLEQACRRQVRRNAWFFYSARTQQDLYCQEEMEALEKAWHKDFSFRFVPTLSREAEDSDWQGVRARATTHFKEEYLNTGRLDISRCRAYFCGPPGMIDTGIESLIEAGMSVSHIYYDKFEDTSSPAPAIDNTKCVLCDECLLVKPTANCIVEISALHRDATGRITGYDRVRPAHTSGLYYNALYIDENECIRCGACVEVCPARAISTDNARLPDALRKCLVDSATASGTDPDESI